jgi:K+-transporting ATPase KdpF subunit
VKNLLVGKVSGSEMYLIGGVVALGLLIYLMVALLKPELF